MLRAIPFLLLVVGTMCAVDRAAAQPVVERIQLSSFQESDDGDRRLAGIDSGDGEALLGMRLGIARGANVSSLSMAAMPSGVAWAPLDRPIAAPPRLFVGGLRPGDRTLCLRVQTADGQYVARGQAEIAAAARYAPLVEIELTARADKIAKRLAQASLTVRDLAVFALATAQANCRRAGAVLPAAWGAAPERGQPLVLLVAGAGRSGTPELARADSLRPARCVPLRQMPGAAGRAYVAYSHACTTEVAAADCGREVDYSIDWRLTDSREPGRPFRMRLPCPGR